MASFEYSSACALPENPIDSVGSSSGAVGDESDEDCSICLEPFTPQDPATVTSCKHEYHLQCILEWCERSKECPICWQLLSLKDPASQELLAAMENKRKSRFREISMSLPRTVYHYHDDLNVEEDGSLSDDSDFDERIMRQLAAAASRAQFVQRRGRQRSSGLGSSEVLMSSSPANMQEYASSTEQNQNISYGLTEENSLTPGIPSQVSSDYLFSITSAKPRSLFKQPKPDSPRGSYTSVMPSFSESIKSRWSAASARYKESISRNTHGLKEKVLACNKELKELSKGVQREMGAGIAGVARMIERLDLSARRPGVSVNSSGFADEIQFKGKSVEKNVISQDSRGGAPGFSSESRPFSSNTPGQVSISHGQDD